MDDTPFDERPMSDILLLLMAFGDTPKAGFQDLIDIGAITFAQAERVNERFSSELGLSPIPITKRSAS